MNTKIETLQETLNRIQQELKAPKNIWQTCHIVYTYNITNKLTIWRRKRLEAEHTIFWSVRDVQK